MSIIEKAIRRFEAACYADSDQIDHSGEFFSARASLLALFALQEAHCPHGEPIEIYCAMCDEDERDEE